mgnify:CR=1 FL=1
MSRYEITVDGKAHSVSLDSPIVEGSKIRARIDGIEVTAAFSFHSRAEPSGILRVQNRNFHIDLGGMRDPSSPTIRIDGRNAVVELRSLPIQPPQEKQVPSLAKPTTVAHGVIVAPIPGRVMSVRVRKGDPVKSGQPLLLLEAMKMENEINATEAGTVRDVWVTEGAGVKKGERLLEIS